MTEADVSRSFRWGYLFLGIFFILGAVAALTQPLENLFVFSIVFGFLAIFRGAWLLFGREGASFRVWAGLLNILIGFLLISNFKWGILGFGYIFAIWFLLSSCFRLACLNMTRMLGQGYYWFSLILNSLGILIGISLFFHPEFSAIIFSLLIGFYILMAGIEFLILAFS